MWSWRSGYYWGVSKGFYVKDSILNMYLKFIRIDIGYRVKYSVCVFGFLGGLIVVRLVGGRSGEVRVWCYVSLLGLE